MERVHRSVTQRKVQFMTFCVRRISRTVKRDLVSTFNFLYKYGAIGFLLDNYETVHTENPDNVVEDVLGLCRRNGGTLK